MSANDVDRLLTTWLANDAAGDEPEGLLDRVLERTARTRRRPGWLIPERWIPMELSMRWQPVSRLAPALLVLALLILGVLVALVVGGRKSPPPPFGPAENGRIAYISDGQLWTVAKDGWAPIQISLGPEIKGMPLWSRDGTRIAYLTFKDPLSRSVSGLVVAEADGSRPVVLASDREMLQYYSWSPDGRSIAYSSYVAMNAGQRDRIFIAPSDGSAPASQVGDPNMSAYDPAFSPDSRKILFRSDLNESGFALQVMNVDGTDIRNLSRSVIEVGAPDELGTRGFDWSHDGRLIVFGGSELRDGKDDLYVVPADGSSAPRRITTGRRDEFAATWSPTGDRIVFLRENDERPYREVIVANADGSRERVIARQVAAVSPQWSPDGHAVVICRDGTGYERTFSIIPVDGGGTPIDIHVVIPDAAGSLSTAPGLDTVGWQRR